MGGLGVAEPYPNRDELGIQPDRSLRFTSDKGRTGSRPLNRWRKPASSEPAVFARLGLAGADLLPHPGIAFRADAMGELGFGMLAEIVLHLLPVS